MADMIPVKSSDLRAVGYDPRSQILYIDFHSGGRYMYSGVPVSEHAALMAADSKGKYFAAHIKNVYPYQRL